MHQIEHITARGTALDGTDAQEPELAEFGGRPGGLWTLGESPFAPTHDPS